jgi:tetraacyldisaccharide 4'-kinase
LLVNGSPADDGQAIADEPRLLAQHLQEVPVLVGRRREQTGRQACQAFHATALILDDGLQYRRLHRDCEIILVNANMPLRGWPLLPRGPMREKLSALRRADIVIVTKADHALDTVAALQERLRTYSPTAVMACAVHEPVDLRDELTGHSIGLDQLSTARVHLLSSIGDPDGFERTVQQVGATVLSHRRFPDHYRYRASDVREFASRLTASDSSLAVTTEKDAVRMAVLRPAMRGMGFTLWVLHVRMKLISGEPEIDDRLAAVLGR